MENNHRLRWEDVPKSLRASIEEALAGEVVSTIDHTTGFSPSLASRCELADGRKFFIKAGSPDQNERSVLNLKRESEVTRQLPSDFPAPALILTFDDGDWTAAVFENVEGCLPAVPWKRNELEAVVVAMEQLAAKSDPSPFDLPVQVTDSVELLSGWRKLASEENPQLDDWSLRNLSRMAEWEPQWEQAAVGTALVHNDIRQDNVLLRGDGSVVFVDWANAVIGAPWLDLLQMLPSVALQGGPSPEEVWSGSFGARHAKRDDVTAVVIALAGYFTFQSLQPDPPGLPTVRQFQAVQAIETRKWVARRTGW